MDNYYSIKIPKPCHEGWDTMTPQDKGRFCRSCNKTVVDFTKMDSYQIQDFLQENKDQRICGHIKQTQLDSINLRIPLSLIHQKHSVYKSFFLATLIIMGTSLFSCSSKNGTPQKIDSIEVVDTLNNRVIDIIGDLAPPKKTDSTSGQKKILKPATILPTPRRPITGVMIANMVTTGELVSPPDPVKIDSIKTESHALDIEGEISVIDHTTTKAYTLVNVDQYPAFQETLDTLSKEDGRKRFESELNQFVKTNFIKPSKVDLELKGKQRIYVNFEIQKNGEIKIIKIKSHHKSLDLEAARVIQKLPKLIPAKKNGQTVASLYALPIIINTEEE